MPAEEAETLFSDHPTERIVVSNHLSTTEETDRWRPAAFSGEARIDSNPTLLEFLSSPYRPQVSYNQWKMIQTQDLVLLPSTDRKVLLSTGKLVDAAAQPAAFKTDSSAPDAGQESETLRQRWQC